MTFFNNVPEVKKPIFSDTSEVLKLNKMLSKWAAFSITHYKQWDKMPSCGHFFGGVYNYGIETASTMTVLAVLTTLGYYDQSILKIDKEDAIKMVVSSIRYLCYTHHTGPSDLKRGKSKNPMTSEKKWGHTENNFFMSSQTGISVSMIGLSALLLYDYLDIETKILVSNVLCYYADEFSDMLPGNGVYNDTQCEENAWTSLGISAALYLYPRHEHHEKWKEAYIRWSLNSVVTPNDKLNNEWDKVSYEIRNGITVDHKNYGLSAITFHPDYTAENHGYVHPDYIAAGIGLRMSSAVFPLLLGKKVSESLFFNNQQLYDAVIKPWSEINGNSISVEGQDWFYHRHGNKFLIHSFMDLFFNDPIAKKMKLNSLSITEQRQSANKNGCFIEKNGESLQITPGKQSVQDMEHGYARSILLGYLLHLYKPSTDDALTEDEVLDELTGNYTYPYGNINVYRTADTFSSFSTRGTIMGLSLPKDSDFDITPIYQSFTGYIKEKQVSIKEPYKGIFNWHDICMTSEKSFVSNYDKGFSSTVKLLRASGHITQYCSFTALENGQCVYIESLLPTTTINPSLDIQTGLIGISNENIPTIKGAKGYKEIYFNNHKEIFLGNYLGENITLTEHNINYVNIDNKIGYLLYNSNGVEYKNIHKYYKWKGLEDILVLNKTDRLSNKPLFIMTLPNYDKDQTLFEYIKTQVTCNNLKTPVIRTDKTRISVNFTDKKRKITELFSIKNRTLSLYQGICQVINNDVSCHYSIDTYKTARDPLIATVTFTGKESKMIEFSTYENNIFINNLHTDEIVYAVTVNGKNFNIRHLPKKLLQLKLS